MCSYTTFAAKVDLCAHTDSKIGIFTRRVYSAYILTRGTLPLLRRLTVGAAIEKNFLFFFVTSFLFGFILDFIQNIFRFYSLKVFSRYSSRLYSLDIISITISDFASDFRLVFPRINFDSFQHCRFYALTLQLFISSTLLLVINKHLCLYEFVLCLFYLF